jgi:hypothetical protein
MTDLFQHMAGWTLQLLGITSRIFFDLHSKGLVRITRDLARISADLEAATMKQAKEQTFGLSEKQLVRYWLQIKWPLYVVGVMWFTASIGINFVQHFNGFMRNDGDLSKYLAEYGNRRLTNCQTPWCGIVAVVANMVFWSTDFCLLHFALVTISQTLVELQRKLRRAVQNSQTDSSQNLDLLKLSNIHWRIFGVAERVSDYLGSLIPMAYVFMLIYLAARFVAYVKVLLDNRKDLPSDFSHHTVRLIVHSVRVGLEFSTNAAVHDEVKAFSVKISCVQETYTCANTYIVESKRLQLELNIFDREP